MSVKSRKYKIQFIQKGEKIMKKKTILALIATLAITQAGIWGKSMQ